MIELFMMLGFFGLLYFLASIVMIAIQLVAVILIARLILQWIGVIDGE